MKVGEIYFWDTDKAQGHANRDKYHLYMCEADWRDDPNDHVFLFISKLDYYHDYPIFKKDYTFFPLETSYVSCGRPVAYTNDELRKAAPELKGRLSGQHLRELYNAVQDSETMEGWRKNQICEILKSYL